MSFSNRRRGPGRWLLACALLAGLVVGGAALYDHSQADRLANGIRIGGVDVGGLDTAAAAERLHRLAVAPQQRTLRVHAPKKTFVVTAAQLRVTADVADAIDRALADSRRGWLGARVARSLGGGQVRESVALKTHYAPGVLPRLVAEVAATSYVAPVDATVKPAADRLERVKSRDGSRVDTGALFASVESAVQHRSRPADIDVVTRPVAAKVSSDGLEKKYPAYIVVDRKGHQLHFYQHLKLAHTWPIAVGRAGLETPSGLYDIQWEEVNPPWRVPNSPWAGALAGKTIPPGPDDPIKARWMAFDGGAGIHGIDPSEYSSIGHDASHGCVRMRIPDVISLYKRSPVGTPVYIA
ncbi:MAG: L,D-transpeptidase ErfK/SrfK [Solirubrobacteraceae bacterium]|nr:L,D-transpeptidase ErfK/SrfK [Solirubrobacteraceae bacterium]